jgi:hypothetical protein
MNGVHRVIASTFKAGATGPYTLEVQQLGRGMGFPGLFKKGMPKDPAPDNPKTKTTTTAQVSTVDVEKLKNVQTGTRIEAFKNIADNASEDLLPRHAQAIARYLLALQPKSAEMEKATAKLASFSKCRHLLLALSDYADKKETTQETAETIIGGVLGQQLRFDKNEDWRLSCRKLLLEQAQELILTRKSGAEEAADLLRDLYKEQGLTFDMDSSAFKGMTRPTQVLESVVKHVASKAAEMNPSAEDKQYLQQLGRHLQVAGYLADNDLEHMVLLQRAWVKVLTVYLQQKSPNQAEGMTKVQQGLTERDRRAAGVLDQLRTGEEAALRLWALVHEIKTVGKN